MKSASATLFLLIGILAIGCGSGGDSGVADAADAAVKAAEAAGTAAKDVASDAEKAVGDVAKTAESAADSPVTRCLQLATEKNWKDALSPCTKAAQEKPDDLRIKHALQQAQAAAKG